ncbi:Hypothetical_protein [Hexamita inflata]|uniref:Hypothetical_protein n=1 Tax=Hexamita inflata TaxID=28002 RepID=A0AA86RDQ6_9EUKA|nr:Hypothetical protein HINF_LOCUS60403 [Hexamita inflata]
MGIQNQEETVMNPGPCANEELQYEGFCHNHSQFCIWQWRLLITFAFQTKRVCFHQSFIIRSVTGNPPGNRTARRCALQGMLMRDTFFLRVFRFALSWLALIIWNQPGRVPLQTCARRRRLTARQVFSETLKRIILDLNEI